MSLQLQPHPSSSPSIHSQYPLATLCLTYLENVEFTMVVSFRPKVIDSLAPDDFAVCNQARFSGWYGATSRTLPVWFHVVVVM